MCAYILYPKQFIDIYTSGYQIFAVKGCTPNWHIFFILEKQQHLISVKFSNLDCCANWCRWWSSNWFHQQTQRLPSFFRCFLWLQQNRLPRDSRGDWHMILWWEAKMRDPFLACKGSIEIGRVWPQSWHTSFFQSLKQEDLPAAFYLKACFKKS